MGAREVDPERYCLARARNVICQSAHGTFSAFPDDMKRKTEVWVLCCCISPSDCAMCFNTGPQGCSPTPLRNRKAPTVFHRATTNVVDWPTATTVSTHAFIFR